MQGRPGGRGFGALTTSSEVCLFSAARDKQRLCSGESHNKYLYAMYLARRKSSITILTITWRGHKSLHGHGDPYRESADRHPANGTVITMFAKQNTDSIFVIAEIILRGECLLVDAAE